MAKKNQTSEAEQRKEQTTDKGKGTGTGKKRGKRNSFSLRSLKGKKPEQQREMLKTEIERREKGINELKVKLNDVNKELKETDLNNLMINFSLDEIKEWIAKKEN